MSDDREAIIACFTDLKAVTEEHLPKLAPSRPRVLIERLHAEIERILSNSA